MGGMSINVDRNVYKAVEKAVRDDGTINKEEALKIEEAINSDGEVTQDEQKLLDGLKGDKHSVLQVKFSNNEPVYELTTFPDQEGSERFTSGKVESARPERSLKEVRSALSDGKVFDAIEWLRAGGVNGRIADLSSAELSKLVKMAAQDGVMGNLLKVLGEKLGVPAAWQLAQKLSPESWGLMMAGMGELSKQEQEQVAMAFGNPKRPDGSNASPAERRDDGLKKMMAVTVYKAAEAKAKGQTEVLGYLATGLDKITEKLDLPAPMKKMFEFYSKVLRELPNKAIDNIMNPKTSNDRSQFDNMMEEMTGNMPVMGEDGDLYPHLKEVYRVST
ncbi:MAG: hypothetical protein ACAI44_32775 [Candidatus Sericytochromatia bacterium]